MEYKELDQKQGWDYLFRVLNVLILKDDDASVEMSVNQELRFRCLFHKRELIYLYLTIDEIEKIIDLNHTPEEIYFYGAYNRINVCQIRVLCNVKQVQITKEYNSIFRLIVKRLLGDKIYSDNFIKLFAYPNEMEKSRAFKSLCSNGRLYRFTPLSFAHNTCEVG